MPLTTAAGSTATTVIVGDGERVMLVPRRPIHAYRGWIDDVRAPGRPRIPGEAGAILVAAASTLSADAGG
jgi:hypothetical protein